MAAKAPFIIRGSVQHGTAAGFAEDTIDLGAFVDALVHIEPNKNPRLDGSS